MCKKQKKMIKNLLNFKIKFNYYQKKNWAGVQSFGETWSGFRHTRLFENLKNLKLKKLKSILIKIQIFKGGSKF